MTENDLQTMKDFATEIGVDRRTVSDLVRLYNVPTKRMTHGMAKGITAEGRKILRKILKPEPAAASA